MSTNEKHTLKNTKKLRLYAITTVYVYYLGNMLIKTNHP